MSKGALFLVLAITAVFLALHYWMQWEWIWAAAASIPAVIALGYLNERMGRMWHKTSRGELFDHRP
jgi:hypothetical protein